MTIRPKPELDVIEIACENDRTGTPGPELRSFESGGIRCVFVFDPSYRKSAPARRLGIIESLWVVRLIYDFAEKQRENDIRGSFPMKRQHNRARSGLGSSIRTRHPGSADSKNWDDLANLGAVSAFASRRLSGRSLWRYRKN